MKNEEYKAKILPTIVDRIFALEKNSNNTKFGHFRGHPFCNRGHG